MRPTRIPGPGISEVCRCCVSCPKQTGESGAQEDELRQHVRLPRITPSPFLEDRTPAEVKKGPAVVFLFSGGVFRGVFQVGFANAVSELGIQPDVVAGASVGSIIGALTGRVFERPAAERTRGAAAPDAPARRDFPYHRPLRAHRSLRGFHPAHFPIHAAAADFSPHDLDLIFRRYEKDGPSPLAGVPAGFSRAWSGCFISAHLRCWSWRKPSGRATGNRRQNRSRS